MMLVVGLLLAYLIPASAAPRRTALVIGNAAYPAAHLQNPVNDASDMADALRKLAFDVILLRDANLRAMEAALTKFNRQLRHGGLGLFYFAGHGIQVAGENYLIPIGANIERPHDVRYEALPVGQILGAMDDAENGINIAILDACRNNPFARQYRSTYRGLAMVQATRGSLIAYATEPGGVAIDGKGRNGIYTKHLLKEMQTPNISVEQMLKQVRIDVLEETGGKQTPWESSSLTGDVYLVSTNTDSMAVQKTFAATSAPEFEMWKIVRNTTYPQDFHDFLTAYPDGQYAAAARLKLKQLTREPDPTPPATNQTQNRDQVTHSSPPEQVARIDPINREVTRYIEQLKSSNAIEKRKAAKKVYKSQYRNHPEILKTAAEELLGGYNTDIRNKHHVDAMAWMCNILGSSKDQSYYDTLKKVGKESKSRKIRGYALKNSRKLQ